MMEPILFYGVPKGCSFGSIVALEWLNQPYRLCRIDMMSDAEADLYRRVNPLHKTPAFMLEDGRIVTQSMAILQHIAARGVERGLAFPPGSAEHDRFVEMLAFLNTTFFSAFAPLWTAYKGVRDESMRQMLRATGIEQVTEAHAELELLLAGREWLAGAHRTLADAYFIGLARWTPYHRVLDTRDYPNTYRLIERLEADPAVKFAHAIEDEQPAMSAGGFRGHVTLRDLTSRLAA